MHRRWWAWWVDGPWTSFYLLFAWFHLYRADSDGHFIIVWGRGEPPELDGYTVESHHWTPRGCRRAAATSVAFDEIVERCGGRAALRRAIMEHTAGEGGGAG